MIFRYIIIIASMVQAFAYSKGPLNGSPLQIKVQMLRDRHLVLREPWFVMGGGSKKPRCRLKAWRTPYKCRVRDLFRDQ